MNYVYGVVEVVGQTCVLGALQGVEKTYEFDKGLPKANDCSADAHFRMSDDYPDNLQLGDVLENMSDLLVVSQRVKELLEPGDLENNEVIPVKIKNHKDRLVEEPYYIIHQVQQPDWIDREQSDLEVNDIDPEKIVFLHELVIDETKIDDSVSLLRMKGFSQAIVMKRELADKLVGAGAEGIRFNEFEDWDFM